MDRNRLHNLFPSMSRAYSTGKDTAHVSAAITASAPKAAPISGKLLLFKKKKKLYRGNATMSTDTPKVSAFFYFINKMPKHFRGKCIVQMTNEWVKQLPKYFKFKMPKFHPGKQSSVTALR